MGFPDPLSGTLKAIVQALHLRRGVHVRTAAPANLDRVVRATAAEATGQQALILEASDSASEGEGRRLGLGFALTDDDTKAVIEIDGVAEPSLTVTAPGGESWRLTTTARRKEAKLAIEGALLSLELARGDGRPWAGNWSLMVEDPKAARDFVASGLAGPGPALRVVQLPAAGNGDTTIMLSVRGEDGTGICRLRIEPAPAGGTSTFTESAARPIEVVARPRRLDRIGAERPRAETGEPGEAPSLDAKVTVVAREAEPGMADLRVSVEGKTARGQAFTRLLHFAVIHLVPRGAWRRRRIAAAARGVATGNAARIIEVTVLDALYDRAGRVIGLTLASNDNGRFEVAVDDPELGSALAGIERQHGSQHVVLAGDRLVRLVRLLPAEGSTEARP